MYIKEFYDMDYDQLKEYLKVCSDNELQIILKDKTIKDKIINSKNKYDFIHFVQQVPEKVLVILLDNGGFEILKESDDLIYKMNGILTNGTGCSEVFKQEGFCEILVENINSLQPYLYGVGGVGLKEFYSYLESNDKTDVFYDHIMSYPDEATKYLFENIEVPIDNLRGTLLKAPKQSVDFLIKNDVRVDLFDDFNYEELFILASKEINIKPILDNCSYNISNCNDSLYYRNLIMELEKANDISEIDKKRQEYYQNKFDNYNKEFDMLDHYYNIYQQIASMDDEMMIYDALKKAYASEFKFLSHGYFFKQIPEIDKIISDKGLEGIREYFVLQSNIETSNMIADSLFKDFFPNVKIDALELVKFNEKVNSEMLSEEDLNFYKVVSNMDKLPFEEKLSFYNNFKGKDVTDKFYDDIRDAKNLSYQMIKDSIVTEDNIKSKLNMDMTLKTGVNIYELSGEPFYAFVKASSEPTKGIISMDIDKSYSEGSSYSLIGDDNLDTFRDPRKYYTLVYTDIDINSVVHTFPVDSYSRYWHGTTNNGTTRRNELHTPESLLQAGDGYNEIIMAHKNTNIKGDELNDGITNPKTSFILCYDEINNNLVESAKKKNLSILLVHTEKYNSRKIENPYTMLLNEKDYDLDYTYVRSLSDINKNVSNRTEEKTR